METPEREQRDDQELKEGDRLSEEEVGGADGLNDAEEAGPESRLPSDR